MTNKRLTKTIEALRKLHNCNENTRIDGIYYNVNTDEIVILFTNERIYENPFTHQMQKGTFNEYCYFNNHYNWLQRVGYFCGVEQQLQHFNSLSQYAKVSEKSYKGE